MTPIETIRVGIVDGNWQRVCDGFRMLTGEDLKPSNTSNDRNLLLQLKRQIDDMLGFQVNHGQQHTNHNDVDIDDIAPVSIPCDKDTLYGKVTLMTSPDTDPVEVESNRKKSVGAAKRKQQNRRNGNVTYKVTCSVCDKEFESSQQLSSGIGQRCPECIRNTRPD
jgi:DNA-directed RNA polymerase subunit RPC12/RpoP